ncbi:hypothetical protein OG203_06170 [Nocardia sp. NBC_01499]|uniref:hypothetical protein n=1 Tax=Nocardia sp. NBC_01499 TaxID=2903597 RepID=UPI003863BFB0
MSSASAAIVAMLPTPPTNVVAAPSAPTITRPVPAPPLVVIDSARVPVIPSFLRANFAGTGALAASYTGSSMVPAQGGAIGALAATVTVKQPIVAVFGGTGALGYSLAFGAGTTRALPAQFGATGTAAATDAAYGCTATLAVTVDTVSCPMLATFGGSGLLATSSGPPPTVNAAANGSGTLSAITGVYATFGGTGTLALSQFAPSGMIKNGDGSGPTSASWTQITDWTADKVTFPGSKVSSNALVAQGNKANATVSASIAWTPGAAFNTNVLGIRIRRNGTTIAVTAGSSSSPAQASAVVAVSAGDLFTVELQDTSPNPKLWTTNITGGSSSALQIT